VNYCLPITTGVIAEGLLSRSRFSGKTIPIKLAHKLSFPIRQVKRQAPPVKNASVSEHASSDAAPQIKPPHDAYAMASLLGAKELDWLYSAPREMGEFITLVFSVNDEPAGLSVSRLYKKEYVYEAAILQIQSSQVSAGMYKWIVGETSAFLAARKAFNIRCHTTCPKVAEALSSLGFLKRKATQTAWWSREMKAPEGIILLSKYRADDGIQPYPN
jgi:hypothetical protein